MSSANHITATRNSAWPFLLRSLVLRTLTTLAPLMLLWLAARRVVGSFEPLPGVALVLLGLMAACAAIVWRHVWRSIEGRGAWREACERYLPGACLALVAVAFSIRGTHPLALLLFWLTIVGEEVWYGWSRQLRRERPHPGPLPAGEGAVRSPLDSPEQPSEEDDEASLLPPGVSQQVTRTADASGETLECLLRVSFAAGEQTQAVHVAFCPPLLNPPEGSAEHLEGAACDIKVTATEVFGARLEVKRRGPLGLADETILLLRVTAPAQA